MWWRWLFKKLRPRRGWLALLLLLSTVLCLPMAISDSKWLVGASALGSVSLLAALLGTLWGGTRLPGWFVGLFGLLSGIEWNAARTGHLLPSIGAVARETVYGFRWLWAGVHGQWGAEWPFASLVADVWLRTLALLGRLTAWTQAGLSDTVSRDNVVLLLFVAIGVWWVSYFAGWQLARGRSALLALLPAGAATLSNVGLAYGAGMGYLRAYLGGTLLLLVVNRFDFLQERWERLRIDYSADLQVTVRLVGLGLSALLLVLALLVPSVTLQQAVDFFWRYAYEPWTQVTQRFDRLFAGRNQLQRPSAEAGTFSVSAHELSGPARTSADLVFYVHTSDPAPLPEEVYLREGRMPEEGPKHYWRALTYDTYTGRGWENGQVENVELAAGDPLAAPIYPHTVLTQTFELVQEPDLAPAANEPVQLDRPSTLVQRSPGDTVGVTLNAITYTIVSHIPSPAVNELRAAGTDYLPELARRYLALPAIPERVRDLAQEVTAQAGTPYDKARAIEDHLRAYDYDLDISAAPPGDDVADYLLFKTRRGYCDYYATTMVVLLRAVGVPARYASGYAMGQYSPSRQAYLVTKREAHAWVEVYFPGYGWIEFEPTPYRSAFVRPVTSSPGGQPNFTPAAPVEAPRRQNAWLSQVIVLLVAAAALAGVFWFALRSVRGRQPFASSRLARQVYTHMYRWAERVHLGPARGDTPLEFSTRLGQALEERGEWAKGAAEETELIGRTYVEARYGPQPLSARDAGRALTAWEKLRSKLRWLSIWRW